MKIFVTSDTYFGRESKAIERGFASLDEMEDTYIENWNSTVGRDDLVFHLGNFGWDPIASETACMLLNGKIHFLKGSFDNHLSEMSLVKTGRHILYSNQIAVMPNQNVIISHWPLLDWPGRAEGILSLHGGDLKTDISNGYRFNVNISNWNSRPVEIELLKEIILTQNQ